MKTFKLLPIIIYLIVLAVLSYLSLANFIPAGITVAWFALPFLLLFFLVLFVSILFLWADSQPEPKPNEDDCIHKNVADIEGSICIGRELGCKSCEECGYYEKSIE